MQSQNNSDRLKTTAAQSLVVFILIIVLLFLIVGCNSISPDEILDSSTVATTQNDNMPTTEVTVESTTATTVETSTTETAVTTETTIYIPDAGLNQLKTDLNIEMSNESTMEPLLDSILNITDNMATDMGLYYYDINSGDMLSINGNRQFRSASTAKIFVVMAMYESVASGNLSLDQLVYYTENDYEDGSGILQEMDLSQGYKLSELAEYAIRHSDNIAFHMIRRITGRDYCYSFYESVIGHPTDWSQTQMSATDAAKLLMHAYTSPDGRFDTMLDHMRKTDFEQAIPHHLPSELASNKIGFYSEYFHDIALIHEDNPYILTIFSEGIAVNHDRDPESLLADLSHQIYNMR